MKVVGPTCALKSSKVGGEDVVRCLSDQSLAISKSSKMEILQHVIDYIWDLQVELDTKKNQSSAPRTPLTTLNAELASISVENGCSDDRIMCR
uniref:DNA-binding protein inhibitor ID-1-like n=2 Tax=Cyprinus carpio TaxID=7962 RepID=A0A8C1GCV9_CYPCA